MTQPLIPERRADRHGPCRRPRASCGRRRWARSAMRADADAARADLQADVGGMPSRRLMLLRLKVVGRRRGAGWRRGSRRPAAEGVVGEVGAAGQDGCDVELGEAAADRGRGAAELDGQVGLRVQARARVDQPGGADVQAGSRSMLAPLAPSAVAQLSAVALVPRLMLRSIVALALITPPARFRLPARPLPMIATQLRSPVASECSRRRASRP